MNESPIVKGIKEDMLVIVYEDEDSVIFLDPSPVAPGHMVVAPKQPYTILEEVPDWLIGKLGTLANKASTVAFETLGAKGTNIIIHNGVAAGQDHNHFTINVIPRFDKDTINFNWKPKQLSEEEMSTVELLLKQKAETVGGFEEKKPEFVNPIIDTPPPPPPEDESDNMMLKQLDRLP